MCVYKILKYAVLKEYPGLNMVWSLGHGVPCSCCMKRDISNNLLHTKSDFYS
jgi:hypothetical protein